MARHVNKQAQARRKQAQRILQLLQRYGISMKEVADSTKIDIVTLRQLGVFTPHAETLSVLSKYVQDVARSRRAKRDQVCC